MKYIDSNTGSISRPFWKSTLIYIILLSVIGIVSGIIGGFYPISSFSDFIEKFSIDRFSSSLYSTIQLFLLHGSFDKESMNCFIEVSRWTIFAAIVLLSYDVLSTLFREQIKFLKIFCYRDHIIICGLNKITINLVEKHTKNQIVVLAEETNKYAETLKAKNVKLLIGDFTDEYFWWEANLKRASKLYAIIDYDKINVKIAHTVFSYLKKSKSKNDTLKCFVLIKDRELKTILEESDPFKSKIDFFDTVLFNVYETGTKYGIAMNIDKILPAKMTTPPEILLVGITEKTKMTLLNLVHCLTMQRDPLIFAIVENDAEKIQWLEKQCEKLHLKEFADIKILNNNLEKICSEKTFNSILVCAENQIDAIKKSIEIRYLLGQNTPNILVFCNDADTFNMVLKEELEKKKIFPIILFEKTADYTFKLDSGKESQCIEEMAEDIHNSWRKRNKDGSFQKNDTYDTLSEHLKQTNRNQSIDNYLRAFIATGKRFDELGKNSLIDMGKSEKETLAMIEHRRWMIEKYDNDWRYSEIRDDNFKRHIDLRTWEQLSEADKDKDEKAINLMINFINNQKNGN